MTLKLVYWSFAILIVVGIISSLVGAALAYYDHKKMKKVKKNLKGSHESDSRHSEVIRKEK